MPPSASVVCVASPSWTVIVDRTRPDGERVSTFQGNAGTAALIGLSCVPGGTVSMVVPFTTPVTVIVVRFWMLHAIVRLVAPGDVGGTLPRLWVQTTLLTMRRGHEPC